MRQKLKLNSKSNLFEPLPIIKEEIIYKSVYILNKKMNKNSSQEDVESKKKII